MTKEQRKARIEKLTGELHELTYPDRLAAAISQAKKKDFQTVIARKQDDTFENSWNQGSGEIEPGKLLYSLVHQGRQV